MKTSTTILLLCLFSFESIAQQNGWTVGLDYNSFVYWNFNKKDWNNLPESYPVKPRSFNGLRTGFSVEKQFEKFGVQANVAYSSQIQNHEITTASHSNNEEIVDRYYNTTYTRHFNYLHLNIYLNKSFEIGYSSQLFLNFSIGFTNSFLTDFKTVYINYDVKDGVVTNQILVKRVNKNNSAYQVTYDEIDGEKYKTYNLLPIYSTYNVGLSSNISLSKQLGTNYIIEVGMRADHDFTNTENRKHTNQIRLIQIGGGAIQDEDGNWYYEQRAPSYNIRLGPFIALKYRITN